MKEQIKNIFPDIQLIVKRDDKQKLLKQRSVVIWLTGLSGSGKTTLARNLDSTLFKHGYVSQILDGDNIRSGINSNLSFSDTDRFENIRRIAEVSKLFINCGIIIINSFISPTEEIRQMAKRIIGEEDYFEVFVDAPLKVCEDRDTKGLYAKARDGKIKNFTGIDSPFEIPQNSNLTVKTADQTVEACIADIWKAIESRISIENS